MPPLNRSERYYAAAVLCIALASHYQALPLRYFISQSVAHTVRRLAIASRAIRNVALPSHLAAFPTRHIALPQHNESPLRLSCSLLSYSFTSRHHSTPCICLTIRSPSCRRKSNPCVSLAPQHFASADRDHALPVQITTVPSPRFTMRCLYRSTLRSALP